MDINVSAFLVLFILFTHYVMDFMCQTDNWAKNKSSSNKILSIHVGVYILPFFAFFGWKYALFNGVAHWVTDYFSSRMSKHFFSKGDTHNGFVVIGADQFIHQVCLILSIPLITL